MMNPDGGRSGQGLFSATKIFYIQPRIAHCIHSPPYDSNSSESTIMASPEADTLPPPTTNSDDEAPSSALTTTNPSSAVATTKKKKIIKVKKRRPARPQVDPATFKTPQGE